MVKKTRRALWCVVFAFLWSVGGQAAGGQRRNVILLIGDGMGFEHVKAASLFAYGEDGKLAMQRLPVKGRMTTHPAEGPQEVTDSAAAATAMATGVKASNGVLSVRLPGDGQSLPTVLEQLAARGMRTGLVTTTYMTHATPAGFAAHVKSRKMVEDIAAQYLRRTRPDVLLGGGGKGLTPEAARAAGYTVVVGRRGLCRLNPSGVARLCGLFGEGHMPYEYDCAMRIDSGYDRLPHLSEMTRVALAVLERGESGFFLMVEGGRIDHAAHSNDLPNAVVETLEFDNAVKEVLRWAHGRKDTLVIVTADHECGGLKVIKARGRLSWPEVTWASKEHTGVPVPVYAWGLVAERFAGELDNTDIPKRIHRAVDAKVGDEAPATAPRAAVAPAAGH
jgi:alkaline phosphatase